MEDCYRGSQWRIVTEDDNGRLQQKIAMEDHDRGLQWRIATDDSDGG